VQTTVMVQETCFFYNDDFVFVYIFKRTETTPVTWPLYNKWWQ